MDKLTMEMISLSIDGGYAFGVLYGTRYFDESIKDWKWSGHWVVGIGYASAPGHQPLVVSNDPSGGIQRIQTYNDFTGPYVGDTEPPYRSWAETAL